MYHHTNKGISDNVSEMIDVIYHFNMSERIVECNLKSLLKSLLNYSYCHIFNLKVLQNFSTMSHLF